jgi:hypothetical protein
LLASVAAFIGGLLLDLFAAASATYDARDGVGEDATSRGFSGGLRKPIAATTATPIAASRAKLAMRRMKILSAPRYAISNVSPGERLFRSEGIADVDGVPDDCRGGSGWLGPAPPGTVATGSPQAAQNRSSLDTGLPHLAQNMSALHTRVWNR